MAGLLPSGPIDTLGVLDAILAVPEQLRDAADAGPLAGLPGANQVDTIVVATPGTTLTAAEIVAVLASPVSAVPVVAHAGGPLPAFVSTRSLVVVGSVDDHPAALDVASAAAERGAACVTLAPPGSALAAAVEEGRQVSTTLDVPVSRVAVGALAVHGLQVLEQLGILAEVASMVSAAADQMDRRREELAVDGNPAARLARRIGRTLPVIHGSDALGAVAARRWKRQVNLDAKAAAFASSLPDLGWDEVSGWGQHGDMTRQVFSLVTLRHDHEASGVAARMARIDDLLDEVVHDRHDVVAEGDGMLAQLLDLVFYGDVTAWHLAQELEVDPGPTAAVTAVSSAT